MPATNGAELKKFSDNGTQALKCKKKRNAYKTSK